MLSKPQAAPSVSSDPDYLNGFAVSTQSSNSTPTSVVDAVSSPFGIGFEDPYTSSYAYEAGPTAAPTQYDEYGDPIITNLVPEPVPAPVLDSVVWRLQKRTRNRTVPPRPQTSNSLPWPRTSHLSLLQSPVLSLGSTSLALLHLPPLLHPRLLNRLVNHPGSVLKQTQTMAQVAG
jgi:hypothetical protein